jgi:hypothetical protein
VSLADFRGRPVVLVFGSFTCDVFCRQFGRVRELADAYRDQVAFVFVYVNDAGHPPPSQGPLSRYARQTAEPERRRQIRELLDEVGWSDPCAFGVGSPAQSAYHAFPQRLVIIDEGGQIAFDAGGGLPNGWDWSAVKARLEAVLRDTSVAE